MLLPHASSIAPTGTWQVDPTRSSLGFAVRHIMAATVTGRFTTFDGTLHVDAAGAAGAWGGVEVAAIDTGEPKRDARLRSSDFFDVERYPTMSFTSTRIEHRGGPRFRIVGELTIRDMTREIELEAVVRSSERGRTTLELSGAISHKAFRVGLRALEAHRVLLGDTVTLSGEISLVRTQAALAA